MTVIAWDGNILAADRQMSIGWNYTTNKTKIAKMNGFLLGLTGRGTHVTPLFKWIKEGRKIADYPKFQEDDEKNSLLLLITSDKKIFEYRCVAYPMQVEHKFHAIGCGAAIAPTAMEMGADAIKAVEVASKYNAGCGNGVDFVDFNSPEMELYY